MEKVNYYLVLEKRLGDYNLIDINKLDICDMPVTNDIAAIDSFTLKFSEKEIKDSIERSNMSQVEYLDGTLKIVSDAKHNLPILSKDMFTIIKEFQNSNVDTPQDLKNKLFGSYKRVVENIFEDKDFIHGILERFKVALRNNNKEEIFKIIEELPYAKSRIIYLNICNFHLQKNIVNENNKETDNKDINLNVYRAKREENSRVLEKLNDVA